MRLVCSTTGTGSLSFDTYTLKFVVSSSEPDGTVALMTDGGVDDASGEWTVTIKELVGGHARLGGPWVLRFNAP